jgi:hypothetical protein
VNDNNQHAVANIFDMFETDAQLEKDGVTLEYGLNSQGQPMWIRVARAGGANIQFLKVYDHITKPYRRQIDSGLKLPKELNDRLNRELYARAVVKGCAGFEERDGTPVPTSTPEEIVKFFERLPNLLADVMVQANNMTLYRNETREEASKN